MTIEQMQKHPFWVPLTPKQRLFVMARCEGKNLTEAGHAAWKCTSDASALAMSQRTLKNANVAALLKAFFGETVATGLPSVEQFGDWLWQRAQQSKDDAHAIGFAKLFMEVMGFKTKPADVPALDPRETAGGDELLTLPE